MVTWDGWEYWSVSDGLIVSSPTPERPNHWAEGVRSIEATTETLLAFNLEALTGLPLHLIRRSDQMDPSSDILATDSLGRIHVFELKQKSISGQAAAQLNQYLLQYVFEDPDLFLAKSSVRGQEQSEPVWLARYITGVWTNHNGPGTGFKKIVSELGNNHPLLEYDGGPLTAYRWSQFDEAEKLRMVHPALASHGSGLGLTVPDLDEIMPVAEYWSERLREQASVTTSRQVAEQRLVLWLVGASISDDAVEEVRRWRRSGIDARVLCVTGRSDGERWTLGVRREYAPQRTEAETAILEQAANGSGEQGSVKLEFYERKSASEHSRHGGGLLNPPIVEIR